MNDLLARMEPALLIPIFGVFIPIVGVIGHFWSSTRKAEAEALLKRELVAAGVPADDIVRIVNSTAGGTESADVMKAKLAADVEKVKARGF